jgi:hypothetical protein
VHLNEEVVKSKKKCERIFIISSKMDRSILQMQFDIFCKKSCSIICFDMKWHESGSFEKRHVLGSLQMKDKNIDSTSNRVGLVAYN